MGSNGPKLGAEFVDICSDKTSNLAPIVSTGKVSRESEKEYTVASVYFVASRVLLIGVFELR